jgi:hypothetical protein
MPTMSMSASGDKADIHDPLSNVRNHPKRTKAQLLVSQGAHNLGPCFVAQEEARCDSGT